MIDRFLRPKRDAAAALYAAIVAKGREPHWYLEGGVADTVDGRFDMIAAILCLVLLRLEGDPDGPAPSAHLAERFVDDMDGQLREIGIGDIVVGKHIGRMMGMLGGRLGAYRAAFDAGDLGPALIRNLYRGEAPEPSALAHVGGRLTAFRDALAAVPTPALVAGTLR
ncbi:MAG TPA: ubiquinol-cytochrome C chaperone family protein [Sphingomonas sp.]|nr:ubiquinol-cytochrome C chaperone family protein [Sphingomonas sp.]